MAAPRTPPFPPNILTPPTKAATVPANSKYCNPKPCAVPDFSPITVPAKPAQNPERAKAITIGRLKGMPAVRASYLAPPMA